MKKNEKSNLCAQVRKQYGDTPTEFAARLGVAGDTVRRWEKRGLPKNTIVRALLMEASKGTFPPTPPRFSAEVEAMTDAEKVAFLRAGFGDNRARFARRLGVNAATVMNWEKGVFTSSQCASRLLRHVMERPQEFVEIPDAFKRENTI